MILLDLIRLTECPLIVLNPLAQPACMLKLQSVWMQVMEDARLT